MLDKETLNFQETNIKLFISVERSEMLNKKILICQ